MGGTQTVTVGCEQNYRALGSLKDGAKSSVIGAADALVQSKALPLRSSSSPNNEFEFVDHLHQTADSGNDSPTPERPFSSKL